MAVPLPFPQFFGPSVRRDGRLRLAAWPACAGPEVPIARDGDVESVPLLARAWTSRAARRFVDSQRERLAWAHRSAAGRLLLGAWGVASEEVDDLQERLHTLAGSCGASSGTSDSD